MSSTNGTGGAPSSFLYSSSMRSTYPSLSGGTGTASTTSGPSSLTTTSASPSTGGLSRLRRYGEAKSEDGDGKSSGPTSLGSGLSYTSKYTSLSDKLSLSSAYGGRISGLDRLAQRQKAFEQANGLEAKAETNGTTVTTNNSITSNNSNSTNAPLASKREMFFKGETTTPVGSTPSTGQNGPTEKNVVLNHAPTDKSSSILNHVTPSISTSKDSKIEYLRKDSISADDKDRSKVKENGVAHPPTTTATTTTNIIRPRRSKDVDATVGFANLPNQVYRKAVKKGFEFTLMVVGESGLGKSTLINSMFLADIYSNEHPGPSRRIKKTIQVETTKVLLKENAVNLTLTIVDTPGFGDAVDNSNCWQPVMDYIENKYDDYLNAESRVNRKPGLSDGRVHACVYFIAPSGHGLKPLDVEFMRRLHDKVNIIPVIAKADTMTPDECHLFKKQIMNEIAQHKIKIYEFPDCEDEEDGRTHKSVKERVPFAVVGSNCILEVDGRKVRGRRYPWGIVEVENLSHCDFLALRNMVIRTHMQDLKDVTNSIHYENFRCRKLAGLGQDGKMSKLPNKNPLAQMEEERKEHEAKMVKMEADMQQVFDMKVKEKRQKIKDSEADMTKRHEQMTQTLERQEAELAEKRRQFENEVRKWEEANGLTLEELRRKNLESTSKETVDGKTKKKKGLF